MKRKIFAGTTLTLFLVAALFSAVPAESQFVGTIKIGVVGPMAWIQGRGMAQGAKLAADELNDAGGIKVNYAGPGWTYSATKKAWKIEIVLADTLRGQPEPTPATGTTAAMELVTAGVDMVIGGFRSEAVFGAREVFMDAHIPFFICGAATNELIDCAGRAWGVPGATCGACVRDDYDRYKYVFRVTPMNSTVLCYSVAYFSKYLIAKKLIPMYGTPLNISVISEALTWADVMHTYLTDDLFWASLLGAGVVDVVYDARVSPVATDVSAELLSAEAAGARLIIPVLSGSVGVTLVIQWHDLGIHAFLGGIILDATASEFLWISGGKCEYVTSLAVSGTRTPDFIEFWDAYVAEYGVDPISTSYGAYDAVFAIKETIEAVNKWPMTTEEQIPHMEKTFRVIDRPEVREVGLEPGPAMLGTFKYTTGQLHNVSTTPGVTIWQAAPFFPGTADPDPAVAWDNQRAAYNATWTNGTHGALDVNPAMMGTLHDVFMRPEDLGAVWNPPYYTRPFVVQWQWHPITYWGDTEEFRLEVVYPINMPFSKKVKIPSWMYSHADTDIASIVDNVLITRPDGCVDSLDMDLIIYCWLSKPGDPAWVADGQYYGLEADQDSNGFINIFDVSVIAKEYGYNAIDEYGTWPLGDP